MDIQALSSARDLTTCAFFFIDSDRQSSLTANQVTAGEHRTAKELVGKGCAVALMVLTFNSSLAAYLMWGEAEFVASVGMTYLVILLVLIRRFGGYWETGTEGGGCWDLGTHGSGGCHRWLDALISFLLLSVTVLLASRVARTAARSTPALLVAAAGAAALGVGGCCAYLLHCRSWSKQQQQKIILPLVQEWSS